MDQDQPKLYPITAAQMYRYLEDHPEVQRLYCACTRDKRADFRAIGRPEDWGEGKGRCGQCRSFLFPWSERHRCEADDGMPIGGEAAYNNAAMETAEILGKMDASVASLSARLTRMEMSLDKSAVRGNGHWMHTAKWFGIVLGNFLFVLIGVTLWLWLKSKLGIAP